MFTALSSELIITINRLRSVQVTLFDHKEVAINKQRSTYRRRPAELERDAHNYYRVFHEENARESVCHLHSAEPIGLSEPAAALFRFPILFDHVVVGLLGLQHAQEGSQREDGPAVALEDFRVEGFPQHLPVHVGRVYLDGFALVHFALSGTFTITLMSVVGIFVVLISQRLG